VTAKFYHAYLLLFKHVHALTCCNVHQLILVDLTRMVSASWYNIVIFGIRVFAFFFASESLKGT